MENTTTAATTTDIISEAPIMEANTLSEKFISYLIRESSTGTATPEEATRKLIELTWAKATQDNRRRVPITEIIGNHAASAKALTARIKEAQTVILNTSRKMTRGVPEMFLWAYSVDTVNSIRILRNIGGADPKKKDITAEVWNGTATVTKDDLLQFTGVGGWRKTVSEVEIPVKYLQNDPIAVAQWVRKESAAYALKNQRDELASIRQQRADIQKEINVTLADKLKALDANEEVVASRKLVKPARKPRPAKPVTA